RPGRTGSRRRSPARRDRAARACVAGGSARAGRRAGSGTHTFPGLRRISGETDSPLLARGGAATRTPWRVALQGPSCRRRSAPPRRCTAPSPARPPSPPLPAGGLTFRVRRVHTNVERPAGTERAARPAVRSRREHLLEDAQRSLQRLRGQSPKPPHEPLVIHGANLVENHVPATPGQPARDAKRVAMGPRRQGCDDEGPEVRVELVGRNHHTGASLADLASPAWVEIDQEDVAPMDPLPRYHRHSLSSNRVRTGAPT